MSVTAVVAQTGRPAADCSQAYLGLAAADSTILVVDCSTAADCILVAAYWDFVLAADKVLGVDCYTGLDLLADTAESILAVAYTGSGMTVGAN